MSRFTLIFLTLALLVFPALAPAQTPDNSATQSPTASGAKDTVLFDFENGNFDGWTLSGDCWDKQPATVKTFIDRQGNPLVSGIVGKGYLTTLFKSAATTGKAVSKEFTIDKPFLTFRIGGGYYPKEACLNLIVDGKIARSETGNDSAELTPASWDVYAFTGKTAHLEVVDATANEKRGYIMADAALLTERPQLAKNIILSELTPVHIKVVNFIKIPQNMTDCRIIVYNRLPLPTAWCANPSQIKWLPSEGKVQNDPRSFDGSFQCQPYKSQAMVWDSQQTGANTPSTVVCDYNLTLAHRIFDAARYEHLTPSSLASLPPDLRDEVKSIQSKINPEILKMAQSQIKSDKRLVVFLQAASNFCCQEVKRGVTDSHGKSIGRYDAEISFKERKGWCGPQSSLFRAFCSAVGIPAREVSGYALKRIELVDGEVNMSDLRGLPDPNKDGNAHIWAEVYLPSVGWVEINIGAANCFDVPSTFIKVSGIEAPYVLYHDKQGRQTSDPFAAHITVNVRK